MRLLGGCVCLATLGACAAKPRPATEMYSSVGSDVMRHVLGARLYVRASWAATCTDWGAAFDNMTSKSSSSHQSESTSCKEKPFELRISCSTECTQQGPATPRDDISVTVVPKVLGPLTITATSRRTDTGETMSKTLPEVLVVLPDRLELRCAVEDGRSVAAPCGPEGVPGHNPMLTPVIHLGDRTEGSMALLVNGKPSPAPEPDQAFSLADLFPEARDGAGIKAGTYPVTLTVGTTTSTWQVVAR